MTATTDRRVKLAIARGSPWLPQPSRRCATPSTTDAPVGRFWSASPPTCHPHWCWPGNSTAFSRAATSRRCSSALAGGGHAGRQRLADSGACTA